MNLTQNQHIVPTFANFAMKFKNFAIISTKNKKNKDSKPVIKF